MSHVNVRFGDVSAHFTVRFPIGFSRAPSPRRGSMPTEPGQALNMRCLGRDPVARAPRLLAIERAWTAPELFAPLHDRGGPSVRPQVSPNKDAKLAHTAAASWGEIGTALPAQFRCRDTIRAEHLECSRNRLCRRVNMLSRPVRRRPRPRAATPIPQPGSIHGGAAVSFTERLARGATPR